MKKYVVNLFLAVAVMGIILTQRARMHAVMDENRRLKENQSVLLGPATVEFRTTDDGKSIAQVSALNLKVHELETANDSLLRLSHNLGIRNRRLMAMAQTTSVTKVDIISQVRDSIVSSPADNSSITLKPPDTLRCISFSDPWITISGWIQTDTFTGRIEARDTLDFIVHKVPKRFLFFRFGCKAIRMDAVNHNPHSTLTHARYIRFTK